MTKSATPQSLTEADLEEAKELDRRFSEAFRRKDLDAVMACMWNSPDLVLVQMGTIYRGFDAVRSSIKQLLDQYDSIKLEVNEVSYLPSGDGLIGVGTATFDMQPASGSRKFLIERWSDLRRKIDGHWVYVLDHTTEKPE
jgi:ketosteroid isomerase-like protein